MKSLRNLTLSLVLPLMFAVPSFAKPGRGQGKDHGGHFGKVCQELNLSPEQKEKLKTIRAAHRETIKPLREKKMAAVKKLREGFKSGATADSLRATHKELGALHTQMSDARFENALAIREILSPEQRVKFDSIKGKVRNRFKDRIRSLVDEEDDTEDNTDER